MACDERMLVDDSNWKEVWTINRPAKLSGYICMVVRGLGFLVLTWSTVVLLGGFVSQLEKADFWCITFITFVQTAGIFDAHLNEKLSSIWKAGKRIWKSLRERIDDATRSEDKKWITITLLQGLVMVVGTLELLPIGAIYLFGLFFSAVVSFWRLRVLLLKNNSGSADNGGPNLNPALHVVYWLAIYQGTAFSFWFLSTYWSGGSVADLVFKVGPVGYIQRQYKFDDRARGLVQDYKSTTRAECQKDPTFATGRNLITYAIDLIMDSSSTSSPDKYRSGLRVLDTIVGRQQQRRPAAGSSEEDEEDKEELTSQHMLIKHLVSSSSSHQYILDTLLRLLDSRGPHDREMRERAARIVAHLAGDIQLEQFPRGIHHISSLLCTLEEHRLLQPYDRDWLLERHESNWYQEFLRQLGSTSSAASPHTDDKADSSHSHLEMVRQGLRILWKLAADPGNCRVMSNTEGLLRKIMAPVASDLVHGDIHDHDHGEEWSRVVEGSLRIMCQLLAAPGEAGARLRLEISRNREAITTVEKIILHCDECRPELKGQAIKTLTRLYMDATYSSINPQAQGKEECIKKLLQYIKKLLHIFITDNHSPIRKLAGEALATISAQGGISAMLSILQENDSVVGDLTDVLLHRDQDKDDRTSAARILNHLCVHYTKDDECFKRLEKSMISAMPEVLGQILGLGANERKAGNEYSLTPDIENPPAHSGDDAGGSSSSSSHLRLRNYEEFRAAVLLTAVLRLCLTVCDRFMSADQDLSPTFIWKLNKMVQANCRRSTVYNLTAMRLTAKMVISMMRHKCYSCKPYDLQSLMASLDEASKALLHLDNSMVFASGECDDDGMISMPYRTLASLVKEAQGLVADAPSPYS